MLQSRSALYTGQEGADNLVKLFVHETYRTFMDRCVTTDDIAILTKYLLDAMGGDVFEKPEIDAAMADPCIFTPFIYEREHGEFMILPVDTWDSLKLNLEAKLEEYNESNIVMNLVLFKDAMMHVTRIIRILF